MTSDTARTQSLGGWDGGAHRSPAHAANTARNAQAMWWRTARWRPARTALWRLLDRHVAPENVVAVIGAGNAHDLPLRRLRHRAGHVDLVDLDEAALRRAQRRLLARRRAVRLIVEDVTFGRADAISRAALSGHAPPRDWPTSSPLAEGYDVVVADLLFTQLLYPALTHAGLPAATIGDTLQRDGQPLTDDVVAWLHASAPDGLVIHVHDLLGWWPGHPQPFTLDDVLALAEQDPDAALQLAQRGNLPSGCDPRTASRALGAEIIDTAFWRWPFAPGVDYLVCATVARSQTGASRRAGR